MNFLSYIIWTPNPEIFPNIDWLNVRWYGLLFALGFIISQQIMYKIYKAEGKPEKDVDSLTLWMIIATIVGARLGHVIFYEPMRYLKDPVSILKTWEGGLASHGAAIGILVAIYMYVNYYVDINPFKWRFIWRKKKRPGQSYLWVVDRIVIVVALTGALIRMGNMMNSEIIGIPTRSNYGVVFARDVVDRLEYIVQIDMVEVKKDKERVIDKNGYVPIKIIVEFSDGIKTKDIAIQIVKVNIKNILNNNEYITMHIYEPTANQLDYKIERNSNGHIVAIIETRGIARHPAQLYESISTFLLFLFLLYLWNKRKQHIPEGLLFGIFLVVLFTLRFLYEFVKENQVDFENTMALNMGQILSIPMVLAGIWILLNLKKLQPKDKGEKGE